MKKTIIKNLSSRPVNASQAPVFRGLSMIGENISVYCYLCLSRKTVKHNEDILKQAIIKKINPDSSEKCSQHI